MALKDIWTNKTDGVDDILADDINAIANEAIENSSKMKSLQENKADKATTLSGYGITDAATIYQLENTSAIATSANEKALKNSQDIKILQSDKADKATTIEGYGITDAYTKTEIDTQIGDIEAALDNIIALQNSCIGGDTE